MATYREERTARKNYTCDDCGRTIYAGSQYICETIHTTSRSPVKNSKKLYHGTVYYHTDHYNEVRRYHIECEE